MNHIKAEFDRQFAHWGITLPPGDVEGRNRGKIVQAGWVIWYLFGSDSSGEYLDYYAAHRMTDDAHVRLYADGTRRSLDTIQGMRLTSDDPEEDARMEAAYFAKNQRVAEMLAAKGFGLTGEEPGGVAINRLLHIDPSL